MPNTKYYYFVSYFNTFDNVSGFGAAQITRDTKITTMEDVISIAELMTSKNNSKGTTILNWKLLRTEDSTSCAQESGL